MRDLPIPSSSPVSTIAQPDDREGGDVRRSDIGWADFRRLAPPTRAFNHLIAGQHFDERFGRWPLPPEHPDALINDVIFAAMIEPHWTPLQLAFVDKDTAKAEATRLAPTLRMPDTLAVIPMDAVASPDDLFARLRPFAGMQAVAKPSQASGAVTFLRDLSSADDVRLLHQLAATDYSGVMREMQYRLLPGKVLVEAMVPTATPAPPDDYKFHCIRGEPLVCQVDHGRFGRPWSRLLRLPDFAPMDPDDGLVPPGSLRLPAPDRIAAMIAAARALAAPFEFVRVDLYDGADGIYFGEMTFTPAASLGIAPSIEGDHALNPTHHVYSGILMRALRRAWAADGHRDGAAVDDPQRVAAA
ncbi:hypothetical protein LPN01_08685 [Sphingomonas sp. A2-49]|uniref:ATP-grasp fold amidoligase family protein n=1 Tax=Sphingomonas sp. A2-49 TaxID=1391375 RepID=UPI0021D3AB6E|nr:ATP-grasp fold amidoligase family protein [Sphingomonas sp. A2-49]MCU6454151.1 hypothetical protein [Sphingomonas sp. A2-49]